tara:strand:- start:738 stop:1874 length:1137 start_codon:yes stop_codon:yes gene_type:complete
MNKKIFTSSRVKKGIKRMRSLRGQTSQNVFLIVVVLTLFLAACSSDSSPSSENMSSSNTSEESISGSVSVSGSSTVEPISTRVKETYNDTVSGDVEITVNGPGTSAGFREFCPGNTDINDASRTIKDKEKESCVPYVELKVAFDGIAVMVNPDNPLECISKDDLYAIAGPESEGNTWEDAQALASSLGSTTTGWPSGTIDVIAPGTESGTYGSFIEIVLEKKAEARAEEGAVSLLVDENGDDVFIRTDYAGQPDDNVIIEGIASSSNGFGWVGFAFAAAAGDAVKVLEVLNPDTGECVAPSIETVADGSYPVSRSLYIYVNTDKAATNPALVSYVDYYLGNGYQDGVENAFGPGVGYVALPADIKAETDAAWASAKNN